MDAGKRAVAHSVTHSLSRSATTAFRGLSVLVTGHTGFKGSWLALYLHRLGARVHGLALAPPTTPSHFEEAAIGELLASDVRGDIRDAALVQRVVRDTAPDVIFHLAAQPLVRHGYAEPLETFSTNVVGTATVLDAARVLRRPCAIVVATSDKCYAEADLGRGYREDDRLGGRDPYSASKAAAELVVAAYRDSFLTEQGIGVASARAGNVIGGGDWASDRIVVDAVGALGRGVPIAVRNPDASRPFQHVLEPLHGYLLLAERLRAGGDRGSAWNLGPPDSEATTVRALVEKLIAAWGAGSWEDHRAAGAPHEAPRLVLDASRARTELGWAPRFSLDETVRRTATWYRCHLAGERARALSLADLDAFVELA